MLLALSFSKDMDNIDFLIDASHDRGNIDDGDGINCDLDMKLKLIFNCLTSNGLKDFNPFI